MKILVTGATGFLGTHLCCLLVREGHQVTAMKRPTSNVSLLGGLQVGFRTADLSDPTSLSTAVLGQEVVIHAAADLAAWKATGAAQEQVNVQGTRNLLETCLQAGVQRFVHISSVAAIGAPAGTEPVDESLPFNLDDTGLSYPLTKHRAEEAVMDAQGLGLDAVIVNPGTMFGPFGREYRGREFFRKVQERGIVFYYTGGRNAVHVDDVAAGVLRALQAGRSGERYILGGENLTYRQIVVRTANELGLRRLMIPVIPAATWIAARALAFPAKFTGRRPRITHADHFFARRCMFFSSEKAQRELGFQARPFDRILKEYLSR